MVRCRSALCALALLALLFFVTAPALAASATFTGTLSVVAGGGRSGFPIASSATGGGPGAYDVGTFAFTLPTAAFVTTRTTPIGWSASAPANTLYTIRSVSTQSSGAGSFGPGAAPSSGFGGLMDTGLDVLLELGIVPMPNVFGSILIPVHVGVAGTSVATVNITANVVTVSVVGTGWTTGTISVSDQTASAPTATTATTFTAVGTNSLGASGGQITLVTPFVVRIRGAAADNRAGYATLTLNASVPEPGHTLLLLLGSAALLVLGRTRRA
jgi:hypothetical protein